MQDLFGTLPTELLISLSTHKAGLEPATTRLSVDEPALYTTVLFFEVAGEQTRTPFL